MTGYERCIAYIYQYDGAEKGKNVGFVKAESRRNRECLQVFLRHVYGEDRMPVRVYGLKAEGGADIGILIGQMEIRDGDGEFSRELPDGSIKPGSSFAMLRGILLQPAAGNMCLAGVWDGSPFAPGRFRPETEQKLPVESPETTVEVKPETLQEAVQMQREQPAPKLEQAVKTETVPWENAAYRAALPHTEPSGRFFSPVWEVLSRRYGKCRPFAEDRGIQCIQVKPADLSRLARAYRSLSGNSFLLHGYYRYNHLLLIQLDAAVYEQRFAAGSGSADFRPHYLLGVPGYYQSAEKNMAEMFGFPDFLPAPARVGTGEGFGYWCTEVQL